MENRTPIYDLQNHCNSRYTIAPVVLRTGFEPVPYHRKWYVFTPSLTQQIVGVCSSHTLGLLHAPERLFGFEPKLQTWKAHVLPLNTIIAIEDESQPCILNGSFNLITNPRCDRIHLLSLYKESNPVILCTKQVHHHLCFRGKLIRAGSRIRSACFPTALL